MKTTKQLWVSEIILFVILCINATAADSLGRIGGTVGGGLSREAEARIKADALKREREREAREAAAAQAEAAKAAAVAAQIQWTSNWFAARPEWRALEGLVFNRTKSGSWSSVSGTAIDVQSGIVVFERWSETEGAIRGGITNYLQPGQFAASNLTDRTALGRKADWKIDAEGRYIGKFSWRGDTLKLYDYGTTPTQSEVDALRTKLGYGKTNGVVKNH